MRRKLFLMMVLSAFLSVGATAQTVRNASNATIGKIESNGTVHNSSNAMIGRIESDGTVRNASNAMIGRVESDGTVRNSSNATIGYARGIKKEWAAVFFFFGMF